MPIYGPTFIRLFVVHSATEKPLLTIFELSIIALTVAVVVASTLETVNHDLMDPWFIKLKKIAVNANIEDVSGSPVRVKISCPSCLTEVLMSSNP